MFNYLKRWLETLGVFILIMASVFIVYGVVAVIDQLFNINIYLGSITLIVIFVTAITSVKD